MKPPPGKRLRTNMKEGVLMLKVQPGMYTIMVHDPRMMPIRFGLQKKLISCGHI
jgi:hypothetical protein